MTRAEMKLILDSASGNLTDSNCRDLVFYIAGFLLHCFNTEEVSGAQKAFFLRMKEMTSK